MICCVNCGKRLRSNSFSDHRGSLVALHGALLLILYILIPRAFEAHESWPFYIWPIWSIFVAAWYAWLIPIVRDARKKGMGVFIAGTLVAIPSTFYLAGLWAALLKLFSHSYS